MAAPRSSSASAVPTRRAPSLSAARESTGCAAPPPPPPSPSAPARAHPPVPMPAPMLARSRPPPPPACVSAVARGDDARPSR
eukprot:474578-Prymnesium_polylepis.1